MCMSMLGIRMGELVDGLMVGAMASRGTPTPTPPLKGEGLLAGDIGTIFDKPRSGPLPLEGKARVAVLRRMEGTNAR